MKLKKLEKSIYGKISLKIWQFSSETADFKPAWLDLMLDKYIEFIIYVFIEFIVKSFDKSRFCSKNIKFEYLSFLNNLKNTDLVHFTTTIYSSNPKQEIISLQNNDTTVTVLI